MGPPPHEEGDELLSRLAQRNLIVVSGKGGVGRTTIAAALGAACAARGRRTLVASSGGDDRLGWLLGLGTLGNTPTRAAPRLDVQRLDPRVCLREYGTLVLRSETLSSAVFENSLVRRLLDAIPGLDDFTVLGKVWHEAVRADTYDTVIFDGPATGHLRIVLGVPQAIVQAVGAGPLHAEASRMVADIRDPAITAGLLVGLPERWPLTELGEFAADLREGARLPIAGVIVNAAMRCAPLGSPGQAAEVTSALAADPRDHAALRLVERARRQYEDVAAWRKEAHAILGAEIPMFSTRWSAAGVHDQASLQSLLESLAPLSV